MALRIAVLLSGEGTTFENLAEHIDRGRVDGEIVAVVSTRAAAGGLERARRRGIPGHAVVRRSFADSKAFNDAVHAALEPHRPDLLVLAGFLSKLELRSYTGRVINTHPALVPAFSGRGFYGDHVYEAVLEAGVKLTGVTVHFCDEEYDTGPIILQEAVPVEEGDTVETLRARVIGVERDLLPRAVQLCAQGRLHIEGPRVRIDPEPPPAGP